MTEPLTMDWGNWGHLDLDGDPIEPPRAYKPRTYTEGPTEEDDKFAAESDRLAVLAGEK